MRTTIEIPNELHQKLMTEAMVRHMKGFSGIIREALVQYFQSEDGKRKKIVKQLKGCLTKKEYKTTLEDFKEGRNNWRI